jgi:hypothetical protein
MVVDVDYRCGRGEEAAGAQDRTRLAQGKSTREGVCLSVHTLSLLLVSTRFSARKLGKYMG